MSKRQLENWMMGRSPVIIQPNNQTGTIAGSSHEHSDDTSYVTELLVYIDGMSNSIAVDPDAVSLDKPAAKAMALQQLEEAKELLYGMHDEYRRKELIKAIERIGDAALFFKDVEVTNG